MTINYPKIEYNNRLQVFPQLPWVGGVNNSLDPSMIPPNQLVQCDHLQFDTRGSRQKRNGINYNWDGAVSSAGSIVGGVDFWYGNGQNRNQRLVTSDSNGNFYAYTPANPPVTGTRSSLALSAQATAWASLPSRVRFTVMNNMLIMAGNGTANIPKTWKGGVENVFDLVNYIPYSAGLPASASRSSSGTTRTILFASSVAGIISVNDLVQVIASANPAYNVQSKILSVVSATVTYSAPLSLTETSTADTSIQILIKNSSAAVLPPNFSMMSQHLGRLFVNDPLNPDRLQYSPVGDPTTWGGIGDSGAIDIGIGDGDPVGITAIFPSFKGTLFVAKQTKLYRIDGYTPETFQITLVSNGIGCVNHDAACSIDETDIYFVSSRGIHSLGATANYGDFDTKYVSKDIQRGFRDNWPASIRPFIQSVYLPYLNSVLFSTADNTISNLQTTIWCYNIELSSWYRWPNIQCNTIFIADDTDKKRFYVGGTQTRLGQGMTSKVYDVDTIGIQRAILYTIKTGQLFPDSNPYTVKGFKKFSLIYRPQGSHTVSVSLQIDNQAPQPLVFQEVTGIDLLGSTFILGESLLGASFVMAPYTQSMDGYGRGMTLTIEEAGINETVEIQGFLFEYESAGTQQEVREGSNS